MKGIFILSLDTEIAWGLENSQQLTVYRERFDGYCEYFTHLLSLLDKYNVAATWAVVGHLFLKSYEGPLDVLEPSYSPGSRLTSKELPLDDPLYKSWFYGSDIIEMIRKASVNHEIGTHTFTHIYTSDMEVTPEIWHSQMRKCVDIHAEHGLTIRSLVYPKNQVKYLESLPSYGIVAYRGLERNWYSKQKGLLSRLCHLIDCTLAFPPPTYDPKQLKVDGQLVNLPASQFLMHYDGIRRWIPTMSRIQQAHRGLERAVNLGQIYHLWFHPHNLGSSNRMLDALESILKEVAQKRDQHQLRVMTMAQAAAWILNGEQHNE